MVIDRLFFAVMFIAHAVGVSASFFSMEKRSQKPSKGDTPFDIPLAPNAGYLRHLAPVLLLVWRINPLRLADNEGLPQSGAWYATFVATPDSKLRLCTTA